MYLSQSTSQGFAGAETTVVNNRPPLKGLGKNSMQVDHNVTYVLRRQILMELLEKIPKDIRVHS